MSEKDVIAPRRRFIAGAVCPQCRAVDRIVLETDDGPGEGRDDSAAPRRRCVACGHVDTLPATSAGAPATRLDGARGEPQPASPVRIIDPGKPQT